MSIEDEAPFFSPTLLQLVKWIASYTASPIEVVLKTAVPASVLKPSARPKELLFVEPTGESAELTKHQAELLADIVRVGGGCRFRGHVRGCGLFLPRGR
jgi:primosomal protein N'